MKGLILKDLMCLRRKSLIYGYLVVVVLVLSVMFVLSAKFGNLYLASQDMASQTEMGGVEVDVIANMALLFFMVGPIAMAAEVSGGVFVMDGKAGFANVYASLPISIEKKVLAKFIAILSVLGIGVIIDIAIAIILSIITDFVKFIDFWGIIISASSIILILVSMTTFLCFCLGYGKEAHAEIIAAILLAASFLVIFFPKIKLFFLAEAGEDTMIMARAVDALKYQYYIPLVIAAIVCALSYIGSVLIAKRKRGII